MSNTLTIGVSSSSGNITATGDFYFSIPQTTYPVTQWQYPTSNGYWCQHCGGWVIYGCSHLCPYMYPVYPLPIYINPTIQPIDTREIEDKLDDLIDEVKKIKKELKKKT